MQNRFVSRPYFLVSLVSLADSFRQGHIMWGVLEFEGVYALRHGFQTVSVFFSVRTLGSLAARGGMPSSVQLVLKFVTHPAQ